MKNKPGIPAELILDIICKHYNVEKDFIINDFRGPQQSSDVRMVCIYFFYRLSGLNRDNIGKYFRKYPSIVNYSVRTVQNICSVDEKYRSEIADVEKLFNL